MAKNKLTESVVKEARPAARQFKLSDGGGLYLLVHSNGSKYWRFDFRFDGKQKSSSLGVWPEVTLAQARLKRNEAKSKISEGVNPIEEKKEKIAIRLKQVQEQGTEEQRNAVEYEKVSQEWNKRQSLQWTGKYTKDAVNSLKSHVSPVLGEKHISDISKQDLITILKNIYKDKKGLFKIIWDIYPGYPVLHLGVLFIILFVSMDFFSALATTLLYFIITVCATIGFDLWNE